MIQERKYRDMRSVGLVSYGQCPTVRRGGVMEGVHCTLKQNLSDEIGHILQSTF